MALLRLSKKMLANSVLRGLFVALFLCLPVFGLANDDCGCPAVECDPCEEQKSVSFYTEKCAGGERIKSCARAQCEPKKPLPMHCVTASAEKPQPKKQSKSQERMPASVQPQKLVEAEIAGMVTALQGKAWVENAAKKKSTLKMNMPVHTFDQIETGSKGKVQVDFHDGSRILIFSDSVVRLSLMEKQAEKNLWHRLLDLFRGQVRNQVKDGAGKYQVRTKHAVVGGEGADFFVNQNKGEREVTRVQTLKGQVELSSRDGEQRIQVNNGERASLVVSATESSIFTDKEMSEFVERGYLTPVHKMSEKEIGKLMVGSEFVSASQIKKASYQQSATRGGRQPASSGNFICSQPAAGFNQCAWECLNNPKGAKKCRADLPQVRCVRRRCNANGMWADEIPLPALQADKCPGRTVKVDSCDY